MSLFVRAYLTIGISLLLAFLAIIIIIDNSFEAENGQHFLKAAKAESTLALHFLQHLVPEASPQALTDYQPTLAMDVHLIHSEQAQEELALAAETVRLDSNGVGYIQPWNNWWALYPIPDSDYYLYLEEYEEPLARDDLLELFGSLLAILMTVAVGLFFLSRRFQSLLDRLQATTLAFGQGDWQVSADTNVPEPVKSIAVSINKMAEQLQRTLQDQQIAVAAVPHEIRTPVARMRFALDMSKQANDTPTLCRQIEKLDQFLEDLQSIIDTTLGLIRTGRSPASMTDKFDASAMAAELERLYGQALDDKNRLNFAVSGNEQHSEPCCDHLLIRQALTNLIDNALHYCCNKVDVTFNVSDEQIAIQVEDDGDGIPEEKLNDLFSPFYRVDESRTRNTGGVGLGLTLVRLIMDQHGGEVNASRSSLGGAKFTLCWPKP